MNSIISILFVFFLLLNGFDHQETEGYQGIKLNQIQVIGTHNSYKKPMDPWIMEYLKQSFPEVASSLDYAHLPLSEQLDMGVRALEIDVFYDPEGGRYSNPSGVALQKEQGIKATGPDVEEMNKPGFKVLHVQDIDYNSHNLTFLSALREIRNWSDAHPEHLPIIISVEPKDSEVQGAFDFVKPLPFNKTAFDDLDREIESVFGPGSIITPDLVRGKYQTLEQAALKQNWPLVDDVRGSMMFVLNANASKQEIYLEAHPLLTGRTMFVNSQPGKPECAVIYRNNARRHHAEIRDLVKKGYIVRTRADAGTNEARDEDYSRLELAVKSGAQIISTDYIVPDPNLKSEYVVRLPGERMQHLNPVNAASKVE